MYTYQDFEKDFAKDAADAVGKVVRHHMASPAYRSAITADKYDHQQNETIMAFTKWLYSDDGRRVVDVYSSNHKLCSNLFNRLNTQRMTYSLGNGVTFEKNGLKEKLGVDFDTVLRDAAYYALIHGESFLYYDDGETRLFRLTEFAPLLDEKSGALRAGVRFWKIDHDKPLVAILYESDGYTRYEEPKGEQIREAVPKRAYRERIVTTAADEAAGNPPEVFFDNYGGFLPVVPMWGSRLHQSTIIGMQAKIDGYDLIQSGFANDLQDCSEIYWLVSGAGGMTDKDLARFRQKLKLQHIGGVPNADDVSITPYVQEIPFQARKELLENLKASIYEDFGGLDVHTVAAGSTNDHIEAAYQPMDENADDFEYQIISAVQNLLEVAGEEPDVPKFKRNRISNQKETAEIVMLFAQYLSDEMIIKKAPFLDADEIESEIKANAANEEKRITLADIGEGNEQPEDGDI